MISLRGTTPFQHIILHYKLRGNVFLGGFLFEYTLLTALDFL